MRPYRNPTIGKSLSIKKFLEHHYSIRSTRDARFSVCDCAGTILQQVTQAAVDVGAEQSAKYTENFPRPGIKK